MDAIVTKYGGNESEIVKKIREQQVLNVQKTIKAQFIEFVGFDKVSTKQRYVKHSQYFVKQQIYSYSFF